MLQHCVNVDKVIATTTTIASPTSGGDARQSDTYTHTNTNTEPFITLNNE